MKHALVVDDETDVEVLFRHYFRKHEGLKFYFARSGLHALEMLERHSEITVVLSDISMPEMNGFALLTKIKRRWPLIQVIMVTAYSELSKIQEAMLNGACGFLTKPVDMDQLELTMQQSFLLAEEKQRLQQAEAERIELGWYQRSGHDILSLLTILRNTAWIARQSNDPEILTEIEETATRCIRLFKQAVHLGKRKATNVEIQISSVDLVKLLQKVVKYLQLDAERKGLGFSYTCPEKSMIDGDELWLPEVFYNLIRNAIKFTEKGEVSVTLEDDDKVALVTIRDTGCGISADQISRIFDFRAQAGDETQNSLGSGIGLAIVKEILALHDASVRVESEFGTGSTFIVALPKKRKV